MLKKYDYDDALKVAKCIQDGSLAFMSIEKGDDGEFYMDYVLKNELTDSSKRSIVEENYKDNISKRVNALDMLNEFIEKQALRQVRVFSMKYDMTVSGGLRCTTARSYTGERLTPDSSAEDVEKTIQRLEQELLNTGSQEVLINAFAQKQVGKTKKYIQLRLIDLVGIIRENLN